jgi:hypothetical protein
MLDFSSTVSLDSWSRGTLDHMEVVRLPCVSQLVKKSLPSKWPQSSVIVSTQSYPACIKCVCLIAAHFAGCKVMQFKNVDIVWCFCEFLTLGGEHRMKVIKKRVLRRIFEHKKEGWRNWRNLDYMNLHNLNSSKVAILTTETSLWTCACASAT